MYCLFPIVREPFFSSFGQCPPQSLYVILAENYNNTFQLTYL